MYRSVLRPLLFQLDPETVHHFLTDQALLWSHIPGINSLLTSLYGSPQSDKLAQTILGCHFANPVGLAAGFDKNIRFVDLMRRVGFGFEEVGSVSALPALGNPKPRLFRLPADEAVINRMGLNNDGISALQARMIQLPTDWPVGISLVKTPDASIVDEAALADFAAGLQGIAGHGAYVSLNISCPNTAEGKTFEEPVALDALLAYLRATEAASQITDSKPSNPWCIKLSPDLAPSQVAELFEIGVKYNVAGWIATNTSSQRSSLKTHTVERIGRGGLSGKPLRTVSTQILSQLYHLSQTQTQPPILIGVGGIDDVESAWEKIIHGANLIQLYTGLVYQGPGLVRAINQGLLNKLEAQGLNHIQAAVGLAFR